MKTRILPLILGMIGVLTVGGATPQTELQRSSGITDHPTIVRAVEPRIPDELRKTIFSAKVIVEFQVNTKGNVDDVHVIYASQPGLKKHVERALTKWKFEPKEEEGVPVTTKVRMPIVFKKI